MKLAHPTSTIHISHSGGAPHKWFVVESGEQQIQSLLAAGRTVYEIKARPDATKALGEKRPIQLKVSLQSNRRRRPVVK